MAITVGFKRATIVILDENGKATEKKHVLEGKAGKGAAVSATISGISPETIKKYGSNIAYYIAAKGVGDVKADLEALDIPEDALEDILGRKKHTDGFTLIGEDTEAPYVAVMLESQNAKGEPVMFSLLKGKMTMDDKAFATNEDKQAEPENEKLSMDCVANDDDQTIAYGSGTELKTKLEAYAFPAATPAG